MTLQPKNFGSTCELSEKFTKDVQKCGIVEQVMSWVKFKQQEQADKKCSTRKTQKLKVSRRRAYIIKLCMFFSREFLSSKTPTTRARRTRTCAR